MITYELIPGVVKTFGDPSVPYLPFDHFSNIVKWYRDFYWAADNVPGYETDIGVRYNVWTRSTRSEFLRHVFPDQLAEPLVLTFEVPSLDSNSKVPLLVRLLDTDGVYFQQLQFLAFEKHIHGRFRPTSWKKIAPVRQFLFKECNKP